MEKTSTCPIWGTPAKVLSMENYRSKILEEGLKEVFYSERADGWYIADRSRIERELQNCDDRDRVKARLTTWLIDQRQLGEKYPEINEMVIKEVKQQRKLSAPERADRLLRAMGQKISNIGEFVELNNSSYFWLAHSESTNESEVKYLCDYLKDQKWLSHASGYKQVMVFHITVEGYAHLAELDAVSNESERAFVAMWFGEAMATIWEEGIRPAIEAAGYKPIRIDKAEFTDKIDDQIIAEIRRSRFLVADFTHGEKGVRGGVYYEAGFAHGLNIPVIFSCRKDCLRQIHFDTRQYPHIDWETPEDMKTRLLRRICAVIGDGPLKA